MTESCLEIVARAAKGKLTEQEVLDAMEREQKIREAFIAAGKEDNLEQRVAHAIVRDATEKKIDAALRRKAAALNIIVREKLERLIEGFKAQGLAPHKAIQAIMEGTTLGIEKGRVSVARARDAYDARYFSAVMGRVQSEKPHIIDLLRDKEFDNAVTKELYELREGGTPGKTGNSDAQYFAKVLAASGLEEPRSDVNRLGGSIGKLDGYAGPQVHDDLAMQRDGADKWVAAIHDLLDINRTFPDVEKKAERIKILEGAYQTIVSGVSSEKSPSLLGHRVGPANLAKSLSHHRVLHFKDAEAALQYRDLYGRGSTIGLIFSHMRNTARTVAAMETFGPNPEVMLNSILARETQKLRTQLGKGGEADIKINKQIAELKEPMFRARLDEMTGMSQVPVDIGMAQLHNNIRGGINFAKLGAATVTSVPTDTTTGALAAMFRGQGFWNGLFKTTGATLGNMTSADAREVSYLIGEGFDGKVGHIANPAIANDGLPGFMARASERFFRWNGLTYWTDAIRGAAARIVAAHLGWNIDKTFAKLNRKHQHVLKMNGIDAAKWEVMRQAGYKEVNGNRYLMPDSMRSLTDEQIMPLIEAAQPKVRTNIKDGRATARITPLAVDKAKAKIAKAIVDKRRELEMDLRGYIADETSNAVVETDPASRRLSSWGTRSGTKAGEAIRYVMQFKGYPVAFANRIVGRAIMGAPGRTMSERFMNNLPHIGALMVGMTAAGYMSKVMKDAMRGIWPPPDPFSMPLSQAWKTLLAAMVQGGGLGIYGDFLFGQASRYGQSAIVTAGGPGVGIASDILDLYQKARDGDSKASMALNLIINNTPYANLFYVRPVLDILFLNALREWASPGYLARQQHRLKKDYNQSYVFPRTVHDLAR